MFLENLYHVRKSQLYFYISYGNVAMIMSNLYFKRKIVLNRSKNEVILFPLHIVCSDGTFNVSTIFCVMSPIVIVFEMINLEEPLYFKKIIG